VDKSKKKEKKTQKDNDNQEEFKDKPIGQQEKSK
jgi:hypothetical protein